MFILHVWTQRDHFHFASGQSVVTLSGEPQVKAVSDAKPGDSTQRSLANSDNMRIQSIPYSPFVYLIIS